MRLLTALVATITLPATMLSQNAATAVGAWPPHSRTRPVPPVVKPGAPALPVPPPADAVVLFDGTSLAKWMNRDGADAKWRIVDGAFEVVAGTGTLTTRDQFGDVQLHVEWMSPNPPKGTDQDRGNSGVFLMGRYELQVLDSYNSVTYADGQAGALYGQYPPLVKCKPSPWRVAELRHRVSAAAIRRDRESRTSPARFTVLHNGILVQDHAELVGPTAHTTRPPYEAHPDRLAITLQDHGHPVRFRNIWLRDLEKQ